jgi:hypothetical protein
VRAVTVLNNAEFAAVIDATASPGLDDSFDASDVSGRGSEAEYRACLECDADCSPEPYKDGTGFRIVFVCGKHGVQSVVDPFKGTS